MFGHMRYRFHNPTECRMVDEHNVARFETPCRTEYGVFSGGELRPTVGIEGRKIVDEGNRI